jgi:Flp pilus assembly protein TadD
LYDQVLQLDPKNALALNNVAMLLSEQPERTEKALEAIDRAIQLAGRRPSFLDTKAVILLHSGEPEKAAQLLQEAVAGPDDDPRHFFHLAAAYARSGQPEKARSTYVSSVQGGLKDELLTGGDQALLTEMQEKFGN